MRLEAPAIDSFRVDSIWISSIERIGSTTWFDGDFSVVLMAVILSGQQ